MEGMVPYIDFADSKGLLLWLIYGIGYLISPTSYIGVFWLSVIAYTIMFEFMWRTARLFVGRRESLLIMAAIPTFLYLWMFHNEVRAEDFCLPWVSIAIYYTCRALISPQQTSINKYAFRLGVSMWCCLFIKWNYFILMGGMALVMTGRAINTKHPNGVIFGLLGMLAIICPFTIYFICNGNLSAMVQEYIINTFIITGRGTDSTVWHNAAIHMLTDRSTIYRNIIITGAGVGIYLFCHRYHITKWLLLTYIPFFLFLLLEPLQGYYFTIAMPFYIMFLITLTSYCSGLIRKTSKTGLGLIATGVCLLSTIYNVHKENLIFFPSPDKEMWDDMQWAMKKQQPRIIISGIGGYDIMSRALPACKYWALQNNPTQGMIEERHQAIRERKADYVMITLTKELMEKTDPALYSILQVNGYRQCFRPVTIDGKQHMKALPIYEKK